MLKNISSNWLLTLVTILVTYVLMPYNLRALGQGGYGSWLLITSMVGYLSLLALGIPMAAVRTIAKSAAENDVEATNRAIGSCAALYIGLGLAALMVGGGMFVAFEMLYDLPPAVAHHARLAFAIVVLSTSASFFVQLPYGIMAAHQDFVTRNAIVICSVLLRFGLTVGLLRIWPSVIVLAAVQTIGMIVEFAVARAVLARRYPALRLDPRNVDRTVVRGIFTFSLYVLLLTVGVQLSFQTDALVIGRLLSVEQVPFFTVGNSLVTYLMEFIIAIAAVIMPAATRLQTQGRMSELRDTFLKWSKIAATLTLLPGIYLLLFGPDFLGWWIGPEFAAKSGPVLQVLMLSMLVFLPLRGVSLPVLMGMGKPRQPAIAFVCAGVANVVISVVLARPLGLLGVAIGTAVPNVVFALYVLVLACRAVDLAVLDYVKYVLVRPIAAAALLVPLLMPLRNMLDLGSILGLAIAGVTTVALFASIWLAFVYRRDRYVDVWGALPIPARWRRA